MPKKSALMAFILAASALAQQPPRATIKCQVIDDISAQPLGRVRITVSGGKLTEPVTTTSDDRGGCNLPPVDTGRYTIAFQKSGYFPRARGDAAGYPPIEVNAAASGDIDAGRIVLTKIRSISGRIRWQDGEHASNVIAHALLVRRNRAEFRLGDSILASTDDRGEFRLGNLKPGRYVVYAYTLGLATGDRQTPSSMPVFYPGSSFPDVNAAVDLRNVAEVGGISMTLQETTGVTIELTVQPSTLLPEGSPVQVGLMIPNNPAQPFAAARGKAGERLRIPNVPLGSYDMIALSPASSKARSFQPLRVDGPIKDLRVNPGELTTLTGSIRYEEIPGAKAADEPPTNVAVWLSTPELQMFGNSLAKIDKTGAFTADVFPGANLLLTVAPPAGLWVSHVRQSGKELPGSPFSIAAGGGPVEIVLRKDTGTVSGAVADKDGKPVRAFVVAAPEDRAKEHLYRVGWSELDGTFTLRNVPPGKYTMLALDRNDDDSYYEPDYLAKFKSKSAETSVAADAAATVALTVAPVY